MEPVMDSESKTQAAPEGPAGKPRADAPQSRWAAELWEMLKTIVIAFAIMLLLNVFVFNLSLVKGQSMEPTLEEQERLFVDKLVYRLGHPKRGEVVVLKDPSVDADRKPYLVKRVVAVPGDTVEVRSGELLVNGIPQNEPYTDSRIEDGNMAEVQLGAGDYFVMGDNRHAGRSKDSRYFGSVKEKWIVGRAEFVFWPIAKIRDL
ncbi:signal peptidase I [Paenibacillus phocaensis]|uniref:signal peptidase I n=1 Tax=Paenibacillus phocaensis TaxID=1776378 RepID=UPI0003AB1401|nr:signal peptidase I [Paenibacillus phocaensis]